MKDLILYNALTNYIKDNKEFKILNNELICDVCNKKINYNTNEGINPLKRHKNTKSHKASLRKTINQSWKILPQFQHLMQILTISL